MVLLHRRSPGWSVSFIFLDFPHHLNSGRYPSSASLLENLALVASVGRKKLHDALGHGPSLVALPATEAHCGSPRARGQAVHRLELAAQMALVGEATLVRHRGYR